MAEISKFHVYEVGPTGFGLQRTLNAKGYCCEIIAPSQIPRRAGDRIKTDGRDSIELAECSRAGQLSAIWIPDPEDEAIRDLSRRGSITKTGNAHARRLLTEAAWTYRFKARIGKDALWRQQALPAAMRTMAWKAQLRLTQRFAALSARGLQVNKACIAVARELARAAPH